MAGSNNQNQTPNNLVIKGRKIMAVYKTEQDLSKTSLMQTSKQTQKKKMQEQSQWYSRWESRRLGLGSVVSVQCTFRVRLSSGVWVDLGISLEFQLWKMQRQTQWRGIKGFLYVKHDKETTRLWKTLKILSHKKYNISISISIWRRKADARLPMFMIESLQFSHMFIITARTIHISIARLVLVSSMMPHFCDP